jgi:hypothetical protein
LEGLIMKGRSEERKGGKGFFADREMRSLTIATLFSRGGKDDRVAG